MRLLCCYPGEPTKGHVMSVLKQCGHHELDDPQTFNNNLKLFKGSITEARKNTKNENDAGGLHIDVYNGNPKDLPKSIYMRHMAMINPLEVYMTYYSY